MKGSNDLFCSSFFFRVGRERRIEQILEELQVSACMFTKEEVFWGLDNKDSTKIQ